MAAAQLPLVRRQQWCNATPHHPVANCSFILIIVVTEELQCTLLLIHCHQLKLSTVNHCHVAHIPPCWSVFWAVCVWGVEDPSTASDGVSGLQLQHLDWLDFSATDRRVDWQRACKFDSVLKNAARQPLLVECVHFNYFPYVSLVDMKCSQATAPREVIASDKASVLDLSVCHTSLPF